MAGKTRRSQIPAGCPVSTGQHEDYTGDPGRCQGDRQASARSVDGITEDMGHEALMAEEGGTAVADVQVEEK